MISDILYRLFPLVLFALLSHFYFQAVYQTDLLSVVDWWFNYISYTNYEVPIYMSLAFTILIFYGQVYTISRNVSALFPGKKISLIYMGKVSATDHLFKESSARDAAAVNIKSVQALSQYSFTDIYKTTVFIKDKVSRKLVIPHSRFSLGQLFFSILFFIAFLPLYLHLYHLLAHLIQIIPDKSYIDYDVLWHESFFILIQEYKPARFSDLHIDTVGFSLISLIFFISIIILGLLAQKCLPKAWITDEYTPDFKPSTLFSLPSTIQPNSKLVGLPVELYQHPTVKYIANVVFKFDYGFSSPVYVTYMLNKTEQEALQKQIMDKIRDKKTMELRLTEKLMLELINH